MSGETNDGPPHEEDAPSEELSESLEQLEYVLFPQLELTRYLEDDIRLHFGEPLPQSISDLRRVLVEVAPQRLVVGRFYPTFGCIPYPPELLADIEQQDVDVLHQTVHTENNPLEFESNDPLCYAWVAMQYFDITQEASFEFAMSRRWNLPTSSYDPPPPESVKEINRLLRDYKKEGVRVPALFFLCAHGALMQRGFIGMRNRLSHTRHELNGVASWMERARQAFGEVLEETTDVEDDVRDRATEDLWPEPSLRTLTLPGDIPRKALGREIERLQLRAPLELEQLTKSIGVISQRVREMDAEQDRIARAIGLKQHSKYADALSRAFLAIRDLISAARPGKRRPRKEVRELLGLWGADVSEQASKHWIEEREAESDGCK